MGNLKAAKIKIFFLFLFVRQVCFLILPSILKVVSLNCREFTDEVTLASFETF